MPLILVVDDEPDVVHQIRVSLERQGYQVETAGGGAEALTKMRHCRPDLLILDAVMPEMDGIQVLSTVRCDLETANLPIILLATGMSDSNIIYGHFRGPDVYLRKPFHPKELLWFVKRILSPQSTMDDVILGM